MCLALYSAADRPLPLIAWRPETPAFHITELPPEREVVRAQFTLPYVYYVGTCEKCGCPFNYGREYPQHEDNPLELEAARECVAQLSAYVRTSGVRQIYFCQFDEEHEPREKRRRVTPEQLRGEDFVFRERELLEVDHAARHPQHGIRHETRPEREIQVGQARKQSTHGSNWSARLAGRLAW